MKTKTMQLIISNSDLIKLKANSDLIHSTNKYSSLNLETMLNSSQQNPFIISFTNLIDGNKDFKDVRNIDVVLIIEKYK